MFDMRKFLDKNFSVRKSGNNIYFCCPFCNDKSYNYWFNPDKAYMHKTKRIEYKGLGRCFKCEKHHNVVSFIMEFKNVDLISALAFIEEDKNITFASLKKKLKNIKFQNEKFVFEEIFSNISISMPQGSSLTLPDELVDWFENIRGYDRHLLKWLKVKYCWDSHTNPYDDINGMKLITLRNRAIFPIKTDKCSGWQAYLFKQGLNNRGEPFPKTRNPPGELMHYLLFLYEFVKNDSTIIINEGIFDSMRVFSRGYSPVCLFGKNLSIQQAYFLSKSSAKEFVMCLDGGVKEELAAVKNCVKLDEVVEGDISIMRLPHGIDPDDVQRTVFTQCFHERVKFKLSRLVFDSFGNISGYNWPNG